MNYKIKCPFCGDIFTWNTEGTDRTEISRLEYFAAQALNGLLSGDKVIGEHYQEITHKAKIAAQYLIEELDKDE